MTKFFVPEMLLDELICINCKAYLSVFPVYISNEGLGGLCGRCGETNKDDFFRDEGYEVMVKDLSFPCIHKKNGCPENLPPPLLEKHERECEFDKFPCFKESCDWKGAFENLLQHFKEVHAGMVLTAPNFRIKFNEEFDKAMILQNNSELYEIHVKFDDKKKNLNFSVKPVRTASKTLINTYNLKLTSKEENYNTKEYFMSAEEEKFQDEDLSKIFEEPSEITVNIVLKQPFKNEEAIKESAQIRSNPNIDWKLLTEMECPICFDHMLPPIYQCMVGHSICEFCKPKVTVCPSCKGKLESTRNFALEKMTQKLNYPCKFYKHGCSFYALSGDIKNHEIDCTYGPLQCPIKACEWSSVEGDIWSHVEEKHGENTPTGNKVSCQFDKNKKIDQIYFVEFAKKVFIVMFKYIDSKFYWTVQLMGIKKDFETFKFEIDVVDLSGNQMRCCWGGLVRSKNTNENLNAYISLGYEQIKNFIKDVIVFKVKVFKE